eukprot:comp20851_c0_seq1/m.27582 comp20851_c0_seq1/g.27582  ORF comp20851_c0_seq1/g.27582 comp20851_c0_seq1/m.27582 type:complete len:230 (-) comp20851_c0_seq1:13-702(-)
MVCFSLFAACAAVALSSTLVSASGVPLDMCKVTHSATIKSLKLTVYNPLTQKRETTTITPNTKKAAGAPTNLLVATVFAAVDSNITARYDFDIAQLEPYEFMLPIGENYTLNTSELPGRLWINYRYPLYSLAACEQLPEAQSQLVDGRQDYSFGGAYDHDQGLVAATSFFDTYSGFMLAVHWFDADTGSGTTCGDADVRQKVLNGTKGVSLKTYAKKCVVPGVYETTVN